MRFEEDTTVLLVFVTFCLFLVHFTCSFYDQNGSAILLYHGLHFLFYKIASNDHVNCILAFLPERKGIPFLWLPYVTSFLLPTDRTPRRPMVMSSRASRATPRFLKLQPTKQTGRCKKERTKNKAILGQKQGRMGQASPHEWSHHKTNLEYSRM